MLLVFVAYIALAAVAVGLLWITHIWIHGSSGLNPESFIVRTVRKIRRRDNTTASEFSLDVVPLFESRAEVASFARLAATDVTSEPLRMKERILREVIEHSIAKKEAPSSIDEYASIFNAAFDHEKSREFEREPSDQPRYLSREIRHVM